MRPLLLVGFFSFFTVRVGARDLGRTAGSVVRSKEWIVRRGIHPEEEFVGEVRYEASGNKVSADWALFRHQTKDWKANGHIVLSKTLPAGDLIVARGETAFYNEETKMGFLEPAPGGRVEFTRAPPDAEPDRGEGARLDWSGDLWAALNGHARTWGPRLEAEADSVRYEPPSRKLSLRGGRPVARKVDEDGGWTIALKADKIDATDSPKRLEARGKVIGWLAFKDQKKFAEKLK